MGVDSAVHPWGQAGRSARNNGHARSPERIAQHRGERLRLAALPKCFPPVSTVQRYFYAWRNAGLLEALNTVLIMNLREIEGREASPSAGVVDSQSINTT